MFRNEDKKFLKKLSKGKPFKISHLKECDFSDVMKFKMREGGEGIEEFLKDDAFKEEKYGLSRHYLLRDKISNEIVAYFSFRTGAFLKKRDIVSGLELMNFATNYAIKNKDIYGFRIGEYVFYNYILPMAREFNKYVGFTSMYIYAINEESLINYYSKLGFIRSPQNEELYIHTFMKPYYDNGCVFMSLNL